MDKIGSNYFQIEINFTITYSILFVKGMVLFWFSIIYSIYFFNIVKKRKIIFPNERSSSNSVEWSKGKEMKWQAHERCTKIMHVCNITVILLQKFRTCIKNWHHIATHHIKPHCTQYVQRSTFNVFRFSTQWQPIGKIVKFILIWKSLYFDFIYITNIIVSHIPLKSTEDLYSTRLQANHWNFS